MIRVLAAQDLADVGGLEQELFGAEAVSVDGLSDLLAGPGRRAWVAAPGAVVDGYALTGLVGDFAELLRIGVRPQARRTGVARLLLARAVAQAVADGAERMLLEVSDRNAAALAFYAGAGFHEIDRRVRYYRDGSAALVLELVLEPPLPGDDRRSGRMDP